MATEQELQQREQQLNQIEQQAREVVSQKVPRRSFGSRIGPKEQQKIIENKQKAEDIIRQVQEQRQQLQQIRQQQSGGSDEQVRRYNYGRKLALSGKGAYGLTGIERQGYIDAKEGLNQIEKIKQSQSNPQNTIELSKEPPQQLYQGPVQQGYSEIQFRITGKETPQTQGPVRLGESEIVFRELGQRASVSEEQNYGFYREDPILPTVSMKPQANKESQGFISSIVIKYEQANKFLRNEITEPTAKYINEKTGLTIKKFSNLAGMGASSFVGIGGYGIGAQQSREFISGITEGIITDIKERPAKQVILFGAGVGLGYFTKVAGVVLESLGTATNIKLFSSIPKYTSIALGTGLVGYSLYQTGTQIALANNERDIGKIVGNEFKNLALLGMGSKLGTTSFEKTYDFIRTIGLKEIQATEIVAPEYFKGQRYPQIKRGQSAGQLKQEFNQPIEALGETKGKSRVLTASPQSFTKDITTGKGTSELYGLYSAPRLSATFLRLSGQKSYNLFSFEDIFTFGKPTALRTTIPVELIPEVSSNQKYIQKLTLDILKRFGGGITPNYGKLETAELFPEYLLPKGKAYIPFIKTEKEAIIPYDTLLKITQRQAYFKLNGRRIVILEAEATGEAGTKSFKTIQDISSSYNYNPKSSSALNPVNIQVLSYSKSSSYDKSISSSFVKLSYDSSVSSSSKPITKISSISYPSTSPPKSPPSYPTYSPPKSPVYNPPTSSIPKYPTYNPPKYPPPRTPNKTSKKSIKGIGQKLVEGYKTYYFTKGNKVYLPSISTKEEAIFKGQKATLNSLSARFGIEETKGLIKDNNVNAPDRYSKYFRNYKISKGKRINTPNVFIQKLGKRLSTKTERGLIQKARRGR